MKKLSKTEAELEKRVAFFKKAYKLLRKNFSLIPP